MKDKDQTAYSHSAHYGKRPRSHEACEQENRFSDKEAAKQGLSHREPMRDGYGPIYIGGAFYHD